MYILLFTLLVLIVNFTFNYWNYKQCIKHIDRFNKWLFDKKFKEDLSQDKYQVTKLVKNAGFYDTVIPITRPMGLGQVVNANIKPIDQYPNRMSDVASAIISILENSKGVYKQRMKLSYNPFLWIEFILYLPSKMISYLGFKEGVISRALNMIWWIVGVIVIPVLIATYSDEISHYVKSIF